VLLKFNFKNPRPRACVGAGVLLADGIAMAPCCGARRRVQGTRRHSAGPALVRGVVDVAQAGEPTDEVIVLLPHGFPRPCRVARGCAGCCGAGVGVAAARAGSTHHRSPGASWFPLGPSAPLLLLQEQPGLSLLLAPRLETPKPHFAA